VVTIEKWWLLKLTQFKSNKLCGRAIHQFTLNRTRITDDAALLKEQHRSMRDIATWRRVHS
jgi:hypothetical protein